MVSRVIGVTSSDTDSFLCLWVRAQLLDLKSVSPLSVNIWLSSVCMFPLEEFIWDVLMFSQERNVLGSLPYPGCDLSYFT